jgi:hypothetical protein
LAGPITGLGDNRLSRGYIELTRLPISAHVHRSHNLRLASISAIITPHYVVPYLARFKSTDGIDGLLGDPQMAVKAIHIAGTKGKGSRPL